MDNCRRDANLSVNDQHNRPLPCVRKKRKQPMKILKPTPGRMVWYAQEGGAIEPALVVRPYPTPPDLVVLWCFDSNTRVTARHGVNKKLHWWYPPRSEETIEVEG